MQLYCSDFHGESRPQFPQNRFLTWQYNAYKKTHQYWGAESVWCVHIFLMWFTKSFLIHFWSLIWVTYLIVCVHVWVGVDLCMHAGICVTHITYQCNPHNFHKIVEVIKCSFQNYSIWGLIWNKIYCTTKIKMTLVLTTIFTIHWCKSHIHFSG